MRSEEVVNCELLVYAASVILLVIVLYIHVNTFMEGTFCVLLDKWHFHFM